MIFLQGWRWSGGFKLDLRSSKILEHPRPPHQELDHDEEEPSPSHLHLLPTRDIHGLDVHLDRHRPCRPACWGCQLWDQLLWRESQCRWRNWKFYLRVLFNTGKLRGRRAKLLLPGCFEQNWGRPIGAVSFSYFLFGISSLASIPLNYQGAFRWPWVNVRRNKNCRNPWSYHSASELFTQVRYNFKIKVDLTLSMAAS